MARLKRLVLERLMSYYRYLADLAARKPVGTITSAQIAEALHVDPTQVRKDLAAIGLKGKGRLGFDVNEVCSTVRAVLGFEQKQRAVLIGTGYLGGMLLAYSGFARYGLHIMAAFDDDRHALDGEAAGSRVRSAKSIRPFIKRHKIRIAILAPPTEASTRLVDFLVSAGVETIWNFTPTQLSGPPGVLVRNERHFSIGLAEIAYHLKR